MPRTPIFGGKVQKLDELIANIKACDTAKCEVYVCPSVLHTAYCCGKFTNGALVTPQYMNFKGCGAFTSEMAVEQMKDMSFAQVLLGPFRATGRVRHRRPC